MKSKVNIGKSKLEKVSFISGITLISLVITIIIIIILAGVAINLSLGENGIFRRAEEAKNKYLTEAEKEQQQLNELYAQLNKGNEPENTKDTEAGTLVKMPNSWKTIPPNYISDIDGSIVKESKESNTVYAVADGKGNTIPVPYGFYYVGGTINSGVVISDNFKDRNKFAGIEDVPSGIVLKNGNIEYEIIGNQFVWVNVNISNYKKSSDVWGQKYNPYIIVNNSTSAELAQIKKYNGFYVGRFEASTSNEKINNDEFGIPQEKPGIKPWNFISFEKAQANAQSMYNTESVTSGLMTGTAWDSMISWMVGGSSSDKLTTNCKWGNFSDTTPEITLGKIAIGNSNEVGEFGEWKHSTKDIKELKPLGTYIMTTGASEECKLKNIYDVAGNLWEVTEEAIYYSNYGLVKSKRGSSFSYTSSNPVCQRKVDKNNTHYGYDGYRVILYMN